MQQRGLHAWNVSCASEAPQQRCLTAARQMSMFKLRRCAGFACLGLHDAGVHTIRAYTYMSGPLQAVAGHRLQHLSRGLTCLLLIPSLQLV